MTQRLLLLFVSLAMVAPQFVKIARAEDGTNEIDRGNYEGELAAEKQAEEREEKMEKKAAGKSLRPRPGNRRPNAYENYVISRGEGHSKPGSLWELRIGAAAGLSAVSPTTTQPGFGNVALNATVDGRWWKYVGAEIDIHGDVYSPKYTDANSATSSKSSRDFLFAAKGQYPFWIDGVRVIPQLGGGYGVTASGTTSSSLVTNGAGRVVASPEATDTIQISGPFGMVGIDLEITRELLFFGDFVTSVGAQGKVASGTVLNNSTFSRIRFGGYYRLGSNWGLGAQFIRRTAAFDGASGANSQAAISDNTQNQGLALVMFEL